MINIMLLQGYSKLYSHITMVHLIIWGMLLQVSLLTLQNSCVFLKVFGFVFLFIKFLLTWTLIMVQN